MTLISKLLGGTGAVLMIASIAAPAQAVTPLYAGGGTLAEKVYRDIFNCYGIRGGTGGTNDLAVGLTGPAAKCNTAKSYNTGVVALYAGVGSGNGKAAFVNHDAQKYTLNPGARNPDNPPVSSAAGGAIFGPFNGTGTGATWVPGTSNPFPTVHFSGSDDPLTSGDLATYSTTSTNNGGYGPAIQFPAFATAITLPFNPAATWTPNGIVVAGASSNVNFTTDTWCGIYTGAITDWNDNAFKAGNQGTSLGAGAITVVYRNDGSGSTFLFTNALIHQCGSQTNPRANITHPVPDQWLADNGIANTVGLGADNIGASNNNFFIAVNTALHIPANFTGAKGSGGVKGAINTTAGAIGYLSPDFVKPIDTTGPAAANPQDFSTLGKTAKFVAPSASKVTALVKAALPPSFNASSCPAGSGFGQSPDGVCAHNPVNWAPTFPKGGKSAYPIGGFTFIDAYSCYADTAVVSALVGTPTAPLGLFAWWNGTSIQNKGVPKSNLTKNGFAQVSAAWLVAINNLLLTDTATKIEAGGAGTTKCQTATGAL